MGLNWGRLFLFLLLLITSGAESGRAAQDSDARTEGFACGVKLRHSATLTEPGSLNGTFKECLGAYLRRQTENPPGHEAIGVDFLEAVFRELGIPTLRLSASGGREKTLRHSLVATLTPSNAAKGPLTSEGFAWGPSTFRDPKDTVSPSVILLNHIDVVGVKKEEWVNPDIAYSGAEYVYKNQNDIWGRGALDMKGIGMLQLFSMAILKARSAKISKTIHFVAVADEEEDAIGAIGVIGQVRKGGDLEALLGAEVALGEGGFSLVDALGSGSLTHLIGTEEKGGAWLEIKHTKLTGLLDAFARLSILPRARKHYVWWASRWGCSIRDAQANSIKTNVSASSVRVTLHCEAAADLKAIRKAFEVADEPAQDAQGKNLPMAAIQVQPIQGDIEVTIRTGSTQHGASTMSFSALDVMAIGLQRIGALKVKSDRRPAFFRYTQTEATRHFVKAVGESHRFKYIPKIPDLPSWIRWPSALEQAALGKIGGALATEELFRTACNWNGLSTGAEGVTAILDCRLGHPSAMGVEAGKNEGKQFADIVDNYVGDANLKIKVLNEWNYTQSPIQNDSVRAMFGELRAQWPKGVPTPWLFPAGSDLRLFREPHLFGSELQPVASYGFFPCPIPMSYISTVHGSNERYPVSQIGASVVVYHKVVERLAH